MKHAPVLGEITKEYCVKVTIHQPNFMPWIGFWNKVVNTNVTVLLLDVQYSRGDVTNRVSFGDQWWTIPVVGAKATTTIRECKVETRDVRRVAKSIRQNLCTKRNPYRDRLAEIMVFLETTKHTLLAPINITLLQLIAEVLQMKVEWVVAPLPMGETKTERLQSVLSCVPGDVEYYSGANGAAYLVKDEWERGRIFLQMMKTDVSPDTILTVLANEPNPKAVIQLAAGWMSFNG